LSVKRLFSIPLRVEIGRNPEDGKQRGHDQVTHHRIDDEFPVNSTVIFLTSLPKSFKLKVFLKVFTLNKNPLFLGITPYYGQWSLPWGPEVKLTTTGNQDAKG